MAWKVQPSWALFVQSFLTEARVKAKEKKEKKRKRLRLRARPPHLFQCNRLLFGWHWLPVIVPRDC
jgi:hypothetical protein